MPGCHAATVTRCDSRADFNACPYCGYSAAGEPFGACPCRDCSAAAGEPFRRLSLPRVQRESSRLLYNTYTTEHLSFMAIYFEMKVQDY